MQSRIALKYLDRLLRELTGQSYQEWVSARHPEKGPKTSYYQIALELAEVTSVESPSPYTLQRWHENPL